MTEPTVVVVRETPSVVSISAPGPQGPVGPGTAANVTFDPTGTVGSNNVQAAIAEVASEAGVASYTHSESPAADTWVINHNMGRVPAVFVVESTGDELEPGRSDPDQNTTILDFDGTECSGTAYFS